MVLSEAPNLKMLGLLQVHDHFVYLTAEIKDLGLSVISICLWATWGVPIPALLALCFQAVPWHTALCLIMRMLCDIYAVYSSVMS